MKPPLAPILTRERSSVQPGTFTLPVIPLNPLSRFSAALEYAAMDDAQLSAMYIELKKFRGEVLLAAGNELSHIAHEQIARMNVPRW